jgi:hypothetical protein
MRPKVSCKGMKTNTRVGGHVANPTNTNDSSTLEFALSSLCAASDEQYESIPDDKIALLVRKFRALHRFRKKRRISPRGCFECGNTTHIITDCPRGRSSTPSPTSMTTPNGTTTAGVTTRRSTTSGQEEEEVLEDDVPSVCSPQRPRLLQR